MSVQLSTSFFSGDVGNVTTAAEDVGCCVTGFVGVVPDRTIGGAVEEVDADDSTTANCLLLLLLLLIAIAVLTEVLLLLFKLAMSPLLADGTDTLIRLA